MDTKISIKSPAIIVGALPYAESDLILRLISETHGKISVLARYARKNSKRFGAQLDIFDCATIEAESGKGSLLILKSFIPIQSFSALRTSLERMSAASLVCECFDVLVHEDVPDDISSYALLLEALRSIDASRTTADTLGVGFAAIVRLLALSGFAEESEFEPRGTKSFERALSRVEEVSERGLRSKSSLGLLLGQLRTEVQHG